MYGFALNSIFALAAASLQPPQPSDRGSESSAFSDLMTSLRQSDVADIYIIRRSIQFRVMSRPDTVRTLGCRYRLHRGSRAWRELERGLADADVRITPTAMSGEVRIALILGDRNGTVREVYARWPHGSEDVVTGFSQRQQVEISSSFARALEAFAANHPDLALPPAVPIPACAPDPPA